MWMPSEHVEHLQTGVVCVSQMAHLPFRVCIWHCAPHIGHVLSQSGGPGFFASPILHSGVTLHRRLLPFHFSGISFGHRFGVLRPAARSHPSVGNKSVVDRLDESALEPLILVSASVILANASRAAGSRVCCWGCSRNACTRTSTSVQITVSWQAASSATDRQRKASVISKTPLWNTRRSTEPSISQRVSHFAVDVLVIQSPTHVFKSSQTKQANAHDQSDKPSRFRRNTSQPATPKESSETT